MPAWARRSDPGPMKRLRKVLRLALSLLVLIVVLGGGALAVLTLTSPGRETLVKYRGQLSISYDEGSATVIVSAPERLLDEVEATIKELDDAALEASPKVEILRVGKGGGQYQAERQ